MKQGDVILTPIPQADGKLKERPAILLREMPGFSDFLVCGISTQLHRLIENFDEIISLDDKNFQDEWSTQKISDQAWFFGCFTSKANIWYYWFYFKRKT